MLQFPQFLTYVLFSMLFLLPRFLLEELLLRDLHSKELFLLQGCLLVFGHFQFPGVSIFGYKTFHKLLYMHSIKIS
ncbi:hypothetical protein CICLE_v10006367mg [Citrus x clementina]|uniref:Uncharacterized protein n=1 Tax=Citrus clementina TaxID=85681 RepID=V4RJG1_CITCL|nr:hypothetical protein CICLE_v10006367mg [Citrus x clementina]